MMHERKKYFLTLAVITALMNTSYAGVAAAEAADIQQAVEQVQTRDVVVTASRTEQLVKEAPAAVEVITRDDMDKMGAENLAQSLKLAAGINIMENGMVGQQVSLRGMKTNQTLIMIDGRRIRTEETDQTANYYELQRIDMNNVERIEIVRGAVSSLYGADAMGGVINIITKTPDKEQTTVSADWTSRQSDMGFRYASGKLDKWDFALSYKHAKYRQLNKDESSTGTTTASGIPTIPPGSGSTSYTKVDNSATNTSNMFGEKDYFNLKADYEIDKKKKLTFFIDYMREDMKSTETSTGTTVYKFPSVVLTPLHNLYNGGIASNTVSTGGGSPTIKDVDYDNVKLGGGIAYSGKDRKGNYKIAYSYEQLDKEQNTYSNGTKKDYDKMKFNQHILESQRTMQLNEKNVLTFGGEYRTQGLDSTRIAGYGVGTNKTPKYKSMDYFAMYIQDEYMSDEKWLVIPSLRFDHNSDFGGKFTYKLGSTYKMSDKSRLKFNVGTSYRAPNLSELYMNWTKNPSGSMYVYINGNPNLKPESALNFDFGIEAEKGKTSGKLTYFMNKVRDLIDFDTTQLASIYYSNYINVGRATIQGVEAELSQKLNDNFTLRAVYNYLDGIDDINHTRLQNRARHTASLQLQYENKDSGISATLWNDWLSDYLYAGTGHGTGTSTDNYSGSNLNFVVSKKLAKDSRVYLGVDNILNTESTALGLSGRIWRAGVNWNF